MAAETDAGRGWFHYAAIGARVAGEFKLDRAAEPPDETEPPDAEGRAQDGSGN
jgi:hypothetical protein